VELGTRSTPVAGFFSDAEPCASAGGDRQSVRPRLLDARDCLPPEVSPQKVRRKSARSPQEHRTSYCTTNADQRYTR